MARVKAPKVVLCRLGERATGRAERYKDTHYGTVDGGLDRRTEFRVRTVHAQNGTRTFLAYNGARDCRETDSEPEHETRIENAEATHALLRGLGYQPVVAFEERRHYTFRWRFWEIRATLAWGSEIQGTCLTLTVLADEAEARAAFDDLHEVLAELGVDVADMMHELCTCAVRTRRGD